MVGDYSVLPQGPVSPSSPRTENFIVGGRRRLRTPSSEPGRLCSAPRLLPVNLGVRGSSGSSRDLGWGGNKSEQTKTEEITANLTDSNRPGGLDLDSGWSRILERLLGLGIPQSLFQGSGKQACGLEEALSSPCVGVGCWPRPVRGLGSSGRWGCS